MQVSSRSLLACACLLGGLLADPAAAQVRTSRPTVSPYLNLTRRGDNAAVNYYNLVRPEIAFRASLQQLEGQVASNQQAIRGLESGAGPAPTGHPSGFQTHLQYFQTHRGGRVGTAPVRPPAPAPAPAAPRR